MGTERATRHYRKLYAMLLRLYPESFRSRFVEGMQQTFQDLCRERQAPGRGLFAFALKAFAETAVGILRERTAPIMAIRTRIIRLMLITASVLSLSLVAMQLTNEVEWSPFDFAIMGMLVFGTSLTFELIAGKIQDFACRAGAALALASGLLLIWMNLAVRVIGSEANQANALYLGVLIVGGIGAALTRLRARGLARA